MHIQQGHLGADIEPVYDRATYVLTHYSISVIDDAKGGSVVFRGTAKDLKTAISSAEKHVAKLLEEQPDKSPRRRAA